MDSHLIERITAEVAKRHKVLLTPDDPIFITATLNELLIERYLERTDEAFTKLQNDLTDLYHQQVIASSALSQRVLQASLKASTASIKTTTAEAANVFQETTRTQHRRFIAQCEECEIKHQKASTITVIATGVAVVAVVACLIVISGLFVGV